MEHCPFVQSFQGPTSCGPFEGSATRVTEVAGVVLADLFDAKQTSAFQKGRIHSTAFNFYPSLSNNSFAFLNPRRLYCPYCPKHIFSVINKKVSRKDMAMQMTYYTGEGVKAFIKV